MGLEKIRNRIKAMEADAQTAGELGRIAERLANGAYYDELADEEKSAYCAYLGTERTAWEAVTTLIYGTLHIKIERKEKPLTSEEYEKNFREVEKMINKAKEDYNSPEETSKRESEYRERTRKGEQRRAAWEQRRTIQTPEAHRRN